MTKFTIAALCLLLLVSPVLAQDAAAPYLVYLPMVGQNTPPVPTFDLRVVHVTTPGACLDSLSPAPSTGQLCPLPGDYIGLVADNPSALAIGGKQGNGADAAWGGNPADFTLLTPDQVITDADVIDIDVPGYVENAGLYQSPGGNFTVIQLSGNDVQSANATSPSIDFPPQDELDFSKAMEQMMVEGQNFGVNFPGDWRFWDYNALSTFTPAACGASYAVWRVRPHGGRVIWRLPSMILMQTGDFFLPAGLDGCMRGYRYVKMAELMSTPYAKDVQDRVNARRGGAPTTFSWFTDLQGQAWAAWAMATGTLGYYLVEKLGSATPNPALFLFIPTEFLDVTCVTVDGIKTCLIQESQPGQ